MKMAPGSVDVGLPAELYARPLETHSKLQQGVEFDGSVVLLSHADKGERWRASVPQRRPHFSKYIVRAALAVFASLMASALLLSVCRDFKIHRVEPGSARRRLSDSGDSPAGSPEIRKMCEVLTQVSPTSSPEQMQKQVEESSSVPLAKMRKLDTEETTTTNVLPETSARHSHHGPRHTVPRLAYELPHAPTSAFRRVSSRTPSSGRSSERAATSGFTVRGAEIPQYTTPQPGLPSHPSLAQQHPTLPVAAHPYSSSQSLAMLGHMPRVSQTASGQEQAIQRSLLPSTSLADTWQAARAHAVEHPTAQHWLSSDQSLAQQHLGRPVSVYPYASVFGSDAGSRAFHSLAMLWRMSRVPQTATGEQQSFFPSTSSAHSWQAARAHALEHAAAQRWLSSNLSLAQQHLTPPVSFHPYADLSGSTAGFAAFQSLAKLWHMAPGSQTSTGQEQAIQGSLLPSTSSADSSHTHEGEAVSRDDLFCRLPVVTDSKNYAELFDLRLVSAEKISGGDSIHRCWKPVALLLCKESLSSWEKENLARLTRGLMAYIMKHRIVGLHGGCWGKMVSALARRFLALDTLVSAMQILQLQRRGDLWNALIRKFPEDYPSKQTHEIEEHAIELIQMLKGAIATLKNGDRPSDDTLRDVKKKLFCLPSSPCDLVNSGWNIWGFDAEGQASSKVAVDCNDPFCRLPVLLERRDYAALFNAERHVKGRDDYCATLESNWEKVARLLLEESLTDVGMKKLVYCTENLVGSINESKVISWNRGIKKRLIWRLARRFLILDTLVSALHIMRVPRDQPWWARLITKFPEDYPSKKSSVPSGSDLVLFRALRRGIATLKRGRRPSNGQLVDIKTKLFLLPSSPSKLVNSRWNIWRTTTASATALRGSPQPSSSSAEPS